MPIDKNSESSFLSELNKKGLEYKNIKPSLTRMLEAHKFFPSNSIDILVGGTNGKGSTSYFLYQMLSESVGDVSLFTSPHLLCVSERFKSSKNHIKNKNDLCREIEIVKKLLPQKLFQDLSYFELLAVVAMSTFKNVSYRIFEVGLGGRWDAVNVLSPQASIITSIGLDHTEFLGDTVEKIMAEKCGIARPGFDLFLPKHLKNDLFEIAKKTGAILQKIEKGKSPYNPPFDMNYSLAVATFRSLLQKDPLNTKYALPDARMSTFSPTPDHSIIIDMAHNLEAIEALLNIHPDPDAILCCFMKDKPIDKMMEALTAKCSNVIRFGVNHPRCSIGPHGLQFSDAIKPVQKGKTLICGSIYGAAEAYKYFGIPLNS